MRTIIDNDNIYPEGSFITAVLHPDIKLLIDSYRQRIYYCSVADHPDRQLVYFEKELIAPSTLVEKFIRVIGSPLNFVKSNKPIA